MPENPTHLPPASWYPDPAGTPSQRWWDGAQWSDHLRAIPAPPVVAPPAPPAPPAPVVPQFGFAAAMPSAAPAPVIPQYAFAAQAVAPAPVTPQYGFATQVAVAAPAIPSTAWNAGGGAYVPMGGQQGASSSGYGTNFRPAYLAPLDNPEARKALTFSLISLVFNPVFIMWIFAFRYAKPALDLASNFEAQGRPPVGRTMAKWARGIPLISLLLNIAAGVATYFLVTSLGVLYNGDQLAQATSDSIAKKTGVVPTSVECPATGSYDLGTVVDCYVTLPSGEVLQLRYTMQGAGKEAKAQVVTNNKAVS